MLLLLLLSLIQLLEYYIQSIAQRDLTQNITKIKIYFLLQLKTHIALNFFTIFIFVIFLIFLNGKNYYDKVSL